MDTNTALLGTARDGLRGLAEELGEPPFRGDQLYTWLYRREASSFEEMTNLPGAFRQQLSERFTVGRRPPLSVASSEDGTRKYLFPAEPLPHSVYVFPGGAVEAALIPEGERLTLCLSTQIGCRRGCVFCRTGKQGFHGNLSAGDILNQLLSLPERSRVTNIVFMGMGEPLDNLEATLGALRLLTAEDAVGMSLRRITLSTVGIHPALERFLDSSGVNLALSLHSPFSEERRLLMPVEAAHPLEKTMDLLRRRREDRRRKLSMEYTLFGGLNHSPAHAKALARLLADLSVRINLIPYHPLQSSDAENADGGALELRAPSREEIEGFQDELRGRGLRVFIRRSRGMDIGAACGMLRTADHPPPELGVG